MIPRDTRITIFGWLVQACGFASRPHKVAARWREAMLDKDLRASLIQLSEMSAPLVDAQGRSLPALDLARRAGMADLARAILALADVTETEMKTAIEAWNAEEQRLDNFTGDDVPDEYRPQY